MSAAGRTPGIRRESDAYPTPLWVTRRLLEAIKPAIVRAATDPGPGSGRTARQSRFFDPCAGRGHIVRAIREQWPGAHVTAWELHETAPESYWGDSACSWRCGVDSLAVEWPQVDVIVMNPPFTLADVFVEKALKAAPVVAVLERVNYFGRRWRGREPSILRLPERPCFAHKCYQAHELKQVGEVGKPRRPRNGAHGTLVPYDVPSPEGTVLRVAATDATEYCWGVWEPYRAARYIVLPDTPLEERKEGSWIK